MTALLVAIDGPSGVGKSTTARALAQRLSIPYVDTGAMYRAVALACLRAGVDPNDSDRVADALQRTDVRPGTRDGIFVVELDGVELGDEIRTSEVSLATSRVSVHPVVRERLVELQRQFGRRHGGVFEGRDIGTVVFPEAEHKFFLEASPRVRAERRHLELQQRGETLDLDRLETELRERDERDRTREHSPLRADDTYVRIDTGRLLAEEVIELLIEHIRTAQNQ
ncbi:MAG: (d)CMP kinase [Acidobacteriota bacterium]